MHVNYLLQQLDVTVLLRYLSSAIVSSSGTIAPDMVLTRWDSHLEYVQQQLQHLKGAKMYLKSASTALPGLKLHFGAIMTDTLNVTTTHSGAAATTHF